jgi:hypothetical protein
LQHKDECRLSFELLDTESETPEEATNTEQWSSFVDQYIDTENENSNQQSASTATAPPADSATGEATELKPVYLPRSVRYLTRFVLLSAYWSAW